MGSMMVIAVLWVLSPLALIPITIVYASQNSALKRKIKELEGRKTQQTLVQQPTVQQPAAGQGVEPQRVAQPQVIVQPQVQPQRMPQQAVPRPVVKPRKKINTMNVVFIIGIIFIVVAGLIFATTTWRILPNIIKASIIALLTIIFFVASLFARKKLHLQQTGLTFYSLGSLFIPLAFLGIGFFELLGSYLSVGGDGKYILSMIAFSCLTFACVFGVKIYKSLLYIWLTYLSGTAVIMSLILQITSYLDTRGLFLAVYCLAMILISDRIKKEEKGFLSYFTKYAYITYYAASIVLLILFFIDGFMKDSYLWIINLVFILGTMSYMILKQGQKWMIWIHPVIAALIVLGFADTITISTYGAEVLGGILLFVLFLCYRFLRYRSELLLRSKTSDYLFLVLCFSIGIRATSPWINTVAATLCMLMILVLGCEKKEDWFSIPAKFLFPWSTIYVMVCFVRAALPAADGSAFMIYYLFMMLFTVLIMLLAKAGGLFERFVLPTSIMLWASGIYMALYDFFATNEGYTPVYLWLLTLYAVVALYENRKGLILARIWLCVLSVTASFSVCTTVFRLVPEWSAEMRFCIPMSLTALLLILYMIPMIRKKLGILERETGLVLISWLHIFVALTTIAWIEEFPVLWIGFVLLAMAVLCYWALHQWGNTVAGMLSVLVFLFVEVKLTSAIINDFQVESIILAVTFVILLALGRKIHPLLLTIRKEQEKNLCRVDWISIGAICIPLMFLSIDDLWRFIGVILLILYTLNFLKRTGEETERPIYTIAMLLLCVVWWVQPFLDLPREFEGEINMIPFLLVVYALYKAVWKGCEKVMSWIMYASIAVCFLWQWCENLFQKHVSNSTIFLIGMLAIAVWALIKKSKRYSILAQILLVFGFWGANAVGGSLRLENIASSTELLDYLLAYLGYFMVIAGTVLCQWTLYRLRMLWTGFIPVGVLLAMVDQLIELLGFNESLQMIVWILIFLSMLVLSYLLHHGRNVVDFVEQKDVLIDWYTILNLVPLVYLLSQPRDSGWYFCGLLMLVVYVLCYYRRIHIMLDRPILSVASFIVCIAWWTQPFFLVPLMVRSEWRMLPLVLFSLFLYKGVWKRYEKVFSWIFCATVAICMIWQGTDAVRGKVLVDVLILGVAALIILVVSFWSKSKRWFLLAGITLVTLILYISKDFWLSLAWWIYLLAVGIILISLASINEYYKKKGEKHESRIKRLMQEWEW